MNEQAKDLKNQVRGLAVGQTLEQPIERLAVVRQYAYMIGLTEDKSYHTEVDRERRVIKVTRTA